MSRYIVSNSDKITRSDTYLVRLECADGNIIEDLEPRKLFPMTDPDRYVSLLDSKENEVALIRELSEISSDSRKALEECFFDYYMIPEISAIISVEDKFGVLKWDVATDRGNIKFTIRNRHSDIKLINGMHLVIRDSDDNRYQMRNISQLDKASLRKIFSYI